MTPEEDEEEEEDYYFGNSAGRTSFGKLKHFSSLMNNFSIALV